MRTRFAAAVAGALAFALAACGPKTEEPADAAPAATAEEAAEEPTAVEGAEEPADSMATDAMALACVKPLPEGAVCTMDVNACGNASVCDCGEGYTYNAALGQCLLNIEGVSEATIVQVADNECVASASSAAICTRDINLCGQPSSCSCEEGFVWNSIAGKCLKDLSAPAQ